MVLFNQQELFFIFQIFTNCTHLSNLKVCSNKTEIGEPLLQSSMEAARP